MGEPAEEVDKKGMNERAPVLVGTVQVASGWGRLLSKVRDASEKRDVVVTTSVSSGQAEILVGDSGPGIAADHLKEVFEPFFTTKPQGMGMGLAIVRTIVEAHHGQISGENQLSGGALFTIKLPITRGRSIVV